MKETGAPVDVVIVAAGRSTRLGGETPKQFLEFGGRSVLRRSLEAFLSLEGLRRIVVAATPGEADRVSTALGSLADRAEIVDGGDTRQASVAAALKTLSGDPPRHVLIHDAARPFVTSAIINRVLAALETADAVIPAIPVADTLKRVEGGTICATVPRDDLMQAQTPQGFAFAPLWALHHDAEDPLTDDAGLMEAAGHRVAVVAGARGNYKLTTREDLEAMERELAVPKVGQGFDVHRLVAGGPLVLGGLTLDEPFRLEGHSDADVALHALTDALLGAIGDGDIGAHFPPSDPQWKGAASDAFLADAVRRVRDVGEIAHLDLTIICEKPKIGPLREAMRGRIADICGIAVEAVSVKATTTERLGFAGRGEGIAAQAVATVMSAR
ncbi:MAG: bifunctional 2-C-methyl-D-erythritol 4-phosphate cytidylyltransferase/2-C-methyl-D-erythritol 2,4-cyclodiphosphate synthase [Pseudomonadota bacterium]